MSLADVASIGSLVSGLAVLASLLFLNLQVRQAKLNQQASIWQARLHRQSEIQLGVATGPSLASALSKAISGGEEMSPAEFTQFIAYSRAIFLSAEDAYYQHAGGLLKQTAFNNLIKGTKYALSLPAMRAAWQESRQLHGDEFLEFMDTLARATPVIPPSTAANRLVQWKADVAAAMTPVHP